MFCDILSRTKISDEAIARLRLIYIYIKLCAATVEYSAMRSHLNIHSNNRTVNRTNGVQSKHGQLCGKVGITNLIRFIHNNLLEGDYINDGQLVEDGNKERM